MSMELVLKDDLAKILPAAIQFNYEDLKQELSEALEKYTGITFGEDMMVAAKNDHATLNKFISVLEEARRNVKKACLKPYEDFEIKVNELLKMVDAPRLEIKKQLDAFEAKRIELRKIDIEQIFCGVIGDLDGLVSLETIYNPKWENKSERLSNIEESVRHELGVIRQGQTAIDNLCKTTPDCEKYRNDALGILFSGKGVTEALGKITELRARDKRLADLDDERKKKMEEVAAANSAAKPVQRAEAVEAPAIVEATVEMVEEDMKKAQVEPTLTFTLRFTDTYVKLKGLREYIDLNAIKYEKV